MTPSNKSLLLKIQSLEKELKQKEQAVKDSNQRVEQILTDLRESKMLIRNIHKSLLPSHLPKIPHFSFSYKLTATRIGVSGDFFDVIQLNNPLQFGVLLSSCNTYTLTSLFLSLFLKSVSALKEHSTAAGYFREIYKNLPISNKSSFHLFYGIVNRRDFTLDYCLKGDMFAGMRQTGHEKSSSSNFQILKTPGSDLKTKDSRKKPFKSAVIELKPKDCLVLCSPGLLHRKNAKGTTFGSKNITKAALSQKGVLATRQNILFQVDQFAGSVESLRDQTVLIMEVKDRILKLTKAK